MQFSTRFVLGLTVCAVATGLIAPRLYRREEPVRNAPVGPGVTHAASGEILSVESAVFAGQRWVLADSRAHRVHVLDTVGRLILSLGRRGRGPGEFVSPSVVAATAARIYVAELGRPHVSVFDSTGAFLRHLRGPVGSCPNPGIVRMGAVRDDLYVLQRCTELPRRIRYRVQRSLAGGPLVDWDAIADTVRAGSEPGFPLHVPLMAINQERLLVGEGAVACFRAVDLPDGRPEGRRCIHELARKPVPTAMREEFRRRWRGRVAVPDSMPRVMGIVLLGGSLVVQALDDEDRATWIELPMVPWPSGRGRPLGRSRVANSFMGGRGQLIAWDEPDGVRIEVVSVGR